MYDLLIYNIQYGKKLGKINKWVNQLPQQPGIICYQEYPGDQINDTNFLKSSGYKYEFAPAVVKYGKTFGELTAYKSGKFTLKSTRAIDLGVSNLEKKVYGHSGQRSALLTVFTVDKQEFMIANLHLLVLATHSRRRSQIEIIIKAMDLHMPTLIVGDFNYSSLIAGTGLARFLRGKGFLHAGGKFHTHRIFGVRHQVDYIFQRNCPIVEVKVADVNYSDHLPLHVKFNIGYHS